MQTQTGPESNSTPAAAAYAAAAAPTTAPAPPAVPPTADAAPRAPTAAPEDDDHPHHHPDHHPTLCAALRTDVQRTFPDVTDPQRKAALILQTKLWAPGTTLTWALMPDGKYLHRGKNKYSEKKSEYVAALEAAFNTWQSLGISIKFERIPDPNQAHIRVTFFPDESWSYVGRDISNVPRNAPTMNIGFMDPDTTALHEVGHVLGLEHEHQSPFAGIEWNEKAVIDWVRRTQGWPEWMARQQILNKLDPNDPRGLAGTRHDPESIMHYPFPASTIAAPQPWATTGIPSPKGLSSLDIAVVRRLYPTVRAQRLPAADLPQFVRVTDATAGSVHAFELIPEETMKYKIEKKGNSDVVMVLLDQDGNKVAGADDAGTPDNANFEVELTEGVRYNLKIRVGPIRVEADPVTIGILVAAAAA